jgi:hypothetical protein
MKECWINVYYRYDIDRTWYGQPHPLKWVSEMLAHKYLIYRIHVKLKQE